MMLKCMNRLTQIPRIPRKGVFYYTSDGPQFIIIWAALSVAIHRNGPVRDSDRLKKKLMGVMIYF